jgi:hypothetical protein
MNTKTQLVSLGANVTELVTPQATVLFSYSTPVAAQIPGVGFVRTERTHSPTTTRHVNDWLRNNGVESAAPIPQKHFDGLVSLEIRRGTIYDIREIVDH